MANMGNQKLKLLTLLRILEQETDSEQGLSMPQIIERLEEEGISAERKSIYRDLNVLRDTGLKIVKLPKRPVEYALLRTDLGLSDVMMLIDVVQSSKFLTDRKSNQLVKSLKDLTSERERKMLDKRIHVQGRIKNQTESVFRNVDTIHEALQLKRKIEFLYFSYGTDLKRTPRREGKRYTLTPVRIAYAYGNYYLAAYSDKAPLTAALYVTEDAEIMLTSSSGRRLLVHTGAIASKTTKNTQGVQIMTQRKNHRLMEMCLYAEGMLSNPHRHRARSLPAAGAMPDTGSEGAQTMVPME